MNQQSNDYERGYLDAKEQIGADLANILRINAVDTGDDNAEVLSDRMVREIFAGVFGVMAADEEFGPEPSGAGVRGKLGLDG